MSIVTKGLMDLHQGTISVYSDGEGMGTTFTVDFPVYVVPDEGGSEELMAPELAHHRDSLSSTLSCAVPRQIESNDKVSVISVELSHSQVNGIHEDKHQDRQSDEPSKRPRFLSASKSAAKVRGRTTSYENVITCMPEVETRCSFETRLAEVKMEDLELGTRPSRERVFTEFFSSPRNNISNVESIDANAQTNLSRSHSPPHPHISHIGMAPGHAFIQENESKSGSLKMVDNRSLRIDGNSWNILVVDDAQLNRKMIRRILERHGYRVSEASDGKEAVKMVVHSVAIADEFHVVIMDFHMPEMDGHVAAARMREAGYVGYIIGLTGTTSHEEISSFIHMGANRVLLKPVNAEVLNAELRGDELNGLLNLYDTLQSFIFTLCLYRS